MYGSLVHPVVKAPNGKTKQVKDLGWLLANRNRKKHGWVQAYTISYGTKGAALRVWFGDGTCFTVVFGDPTVLESFAARFLDHWLCQRGGLSG